MNKKQILEGVLKDEELEVYWPDTNTDAVSVLNLQSSSNIFLRLVAMHNVARDEAISDRRIANQLNSFLK